MNKKLIPFLLILVLVTSIGLPPLTVDVEAGGPEPEREPVTIGEIWADPILFEEFSNYIRLNFTMFAVDFYKGTAGYNVIYDGNGEIVVYNERQTLQYWAGSQWKQRGVPFDLTWVKVDDHHYNVTRHYEDYLGTFYNVTFIVRSDHEVKSVISIDSGQTDEYRLLWQMAGIVHEDWSESGNQVVFGNANAEHGWITFDWEDVYQSFGDITETSVETSAQGKKADIYFNIGTIEMGQNLVIDPSTVGTATSTSAVGLEEYAYRQQTLYANGNYFCFYQADGEVHYRNSSNGATWSADQLLTDSSGYHFDIIFDGTYLHYVVAQGYTNDMFYRMGEPEADGSITWLAVEQLVKAAGASDYIHFPTITVDSDGYPWIGYDFEDQDDDHEAGIFKSSTKDGTWTTAGGFPEVLKENSYSGRYWYVRIIALTDLKMYALLGTLGQKLTGFLWNGTHWGSEESIHTDCLWGAFSASSIDDDVHLAFNRETSPRAIKYKRRTYGVGWGAEVTIQASGLGQVTPSLTASDPDLYCMWAGQPLGGKIYYKRWINGTWDTDPTLLWTEALYKNYTLCASRYDYEDTITAAWLIGTGSPYDIRFGYVDIPNEPTITSATITDMNVTDNVYEMKDYYTFVVEVNDEDGASDIDMVYLQGKQGAAVRFEVRATDLTGAGAWAIQTGDSIIDLDSGSCIWAEDGENGTATFKIRFEWDYADEPNCEIAVYVEDSVGASDGFTDMQTDYFDVIGRLVTYHLLANVTSMGIDHPIQINGSVRYATTVSGNLASSLYPPDAQFTNVSIINDQDEIEVNDTAIVNGVFDVIFNSYEIVRTTYYYVHLDLLDDYVDGFAPDGDYVYVVTTSPFTISWLIDQAFEFFGIGGYIVSITAYGTALGTYFTDSVSNILLLIVQQFRVVLQVFNFFIDWYTRMVSLFIAIGEAITGLLDGTGSITTGLGNIWTFIAFGTWIDVVPIFFFLWWIESVASRGETQGEISVFLGDMQTVMNITSWFISMFSLVINTMTDLAFRLMSVIT